VSWQRCWPLDPQETVMVWLAREAARAWEPEEGFCRRKLQLPGVYIVRYVLREVLDPYVHLG
jgi:hypothetical protein